MVQLDDQNKTNLQKNSNNVIINPSEKTSLKQFDEHLASFERHWSFEKCAQTKSDKIIGIDFYGNNCHKKCNESLKTHCDTICSANTPSTILNNENGAADDDNHVDNNNYDDDEYVISTTASPSYTNQNSNHLNYRYQKVYQDGTDKTGYYTNTFFVNNIKGNEHQPQQYRRNTSANSIDLSKPQNSDCTENQQQPDYNMGSNVSRSTAKGLSGRRTQSSGDLSNRNKTAEKPNQIVTATQAIDSSPVKDEDQISNTVCLPAEHSHLTHIKRNERSKIFGSLPNHLDSEETYRENLYNKNKAHTKRPTDRNGIKCNGIASSPFKGLPSKHSSHHQNTKLPYNNETGMHLKLAINRSNMDVGCDQGYGSERSPEDELPPILSIPYQSIEAQPLYQQKSQQFMRDTISESDFNFITPDCCFSVQVVKNERGLGISVYGGIDANVPYRGLIRIKRLFPNQSAWSTGMLQPGDILLEANEIPLSGLTNHEALEVLRTTPNVVNLKVCRPHDEQFRKLSPPAEAPKPPQRSHANVNQPQQQEPQSPLQKTFTGEFEIVMVKQQGSLGFTLRKEDDSVLGHYVRALVRDPAVSEGRDGRIRPGDKIVAVNDVPLCPMSHEEAVLFLRQATDRVKLRLFRDISQTPIASISPSSSEQFIPNTGKPKASLRPEAMNLLIDLAHKNRKQSGDSYSTGSSVQSSSASPRRLRRNNNKVNSNDNNTNSYSENSTTKSFNVQNQTYTMTTQSSICSDSETSTISQGSFVDQAVKKAQQPCNSAMLDSTFTVDNYYMPQQQQQQNRSCGDDTEYYNDEELWQLMDVDGNGSVSNQSRDRPNYLDVYGNSGGYAVVTRKPMYQFSAANGYELNNLDNEALDAPVYNSMLPNTNLNDQHQPYQEAMNGDYTSLPCEAFSMATRTNSNSITNMDEFSHKNPVYQSAHVQVTSKPIVNNEESYNNIDNSEEGTKNLLKWKGVMFGIDETDNAMTMVNAQTPLSNETTLTTSSEPDSSCATMIEINQIATDNAKDIDPMDRIALDDKNQEIITVELSRGWNSRLGFSLQTESNSKHTIISAIYSESVAAKDGRLRVGDRIVMVNDESVEAMNTAEIIDLLRIVRGSIVLVIKRSHT